jgi:hypothetical protein
LVLANDHHGRNSNNESIGRTHNHSLPCQHNKINESLQGKNSGRKCVLDSYNDNHAIHATHAYSISKTHRRNTRSSTLNYNRHKNIKTLRSTRKGKSREIQGKTRPAVCALFFLILLFPFAVWYQEILTALRKVWFAGTARLRGLT